MADNRIRLPSSEGGLVRYGDEEEGSKLILKPEVVIGICVGLIVLGIILSVYGKGWLGL